MNREQQTVTCGLCGEPMPPGEEMFNYHGYSGPCPKKTGDSTPPATPEPVAPTPVETPTLRTLARVLGWGNAMSDGDILRFAVDREQLLRLAQDLLETHKSHALSAESAIRERIEQLRASQPPSPVTDAREQIAKKLEQFRALLVDFQLGTKPRGKSREELAEIAGVQGTLRVVLAEFDKRFGSSPSTPGAK